MPKVRKPSVRDIKLRIVKKAAAAQARALLITRRKIAWVLKNFPKESLNLAEETLKTRRTGAKQWEKLLKDKTCEELAELLLNTSQKHQKLLSCHPFGGTLAIYEKSQNKSA